MARATRCTCCARDMEQPRPQYWNQDRGTGICEGCLDSAGRHYDERGFLLTYGEPGKHYARLPSTLRESRS